MTIHYRETSLQAAAPEAVSHQNKKTSSAPNSLSFMAASYRHFGKRIMDLTVCLLAAPFVVPIVAFLAILVSRDGGSAFYCQERIGQNGRHYKMWKLRSMVSDADQILEAYLVSEPQARAEWNRDQKLKSDPRITRFGHLLRKSSLDELPQLWNVVRGDMSLVGPRPMMTCQKSLYPGQKYYDMLPGISGSWQVSDRNSSSFAERAVFDTAYYQDLSFREDLRILKATVGVVFKATGC